MRISRVAYAFLRPGGSPPQSRRHQVPADIAAFLVEHIADLQDRARKGTTAPARFRPPTARERFARLASGTDKEFDDTAAEMSNRVFTAFDRRSKAGFLVAVTAQAEADGDASAAVLKLDVNPKHAAAVDTSRSEPTLEAVRDLLDVPGELQKGAIWPDERADSDLVVGDNLPDAALFFLRALEVQQIAAPSKATGVLIEIVEAIAPNKVQATAAAVETYGGPVSIEQLLQDHPELFEDEQRQQVVTQLRQLDKPVQILNPARNPIKAVVKAAGIVIQGPRAVIDNSVTWQREGADWLIQIRVQDQPYKTYR